ncbi:MAG: DUF1015 domain-containing protein [Acidimicrobiales bacterium]
MPRFSPFRGVHYQPDRCDPALVTAPPYDVLDARDRATLAAADPANIVVIDLPVDGEDPYATAGETLRAWLAGGVLVRDETPSFYVYRMTYADDTGSRRRTTGVLGALELSRPGEGGILPHEHTTPKAKSDRLNLLRGTDANVSPVWGLSPAAGLSELLAVDEPPIFEWTDDAQVTHDLWIVDDPERIAAISAEIGRAPVVIADGHHRYETSLAYRDEQRAAGRDTPAGSGPEAVLTYVVELVDDELTVLPIHRLLSGLPDGFDLRGALAEWFEIGPALDRVDAEVADRVAADGALVLVTPEGAWPMVPRADRFDGVRDLDTSRLDAALADLPPHGLVFQHGVEHVVERVSRGDAQAGVLLRPATVGQIVAIAHGGERMPPKTTFFHPKPRTGVVIRLLDE